jgi:RHS repeat-associated protein
MYEQIQNGHVDNDKSWFAGAAESVSPDAAGRQVNAKVGAETFAFCNSYYGYQGGALLFEKEISGGIYENNVVSSHSFIDYYIFLNGRKVGMYIRDDVDNGEEESYYYLYDGQGNVVEVANKVGDLPWYLYTYTTYGNTTSVESNEGEDDLLGLYKSYDEGPFGYKTGVRHYDPETGVFISPDPFKGYMGDPPSQHPYMYCHGNPIAFSDPSGYATIHILYGTDRTHYTKGDLDRLRDGGKNTVVEYGFNEYNFKNSLQNSDYIILRAHGDASEKSGALLYVVKDNGQHFKSKDYVNMIVNTPNKTCRIVYADLCFGGNLDSDGTEKMKSLKNTQYVGYSWKSASSTVGISVLEAVLKGSSLQNALNKHLPLQGSVVFITRHKIYP